MGRLDDAAKRKVVELRRAGLSFRKIKAVLELENIKVSAQAIYLFLKEFQGKSTPEQVDGRITQALVSVQAYAEGSAGAGRSAGWSKQQQWTMVHDPSGNTGYNTSNVDSTQHDAAPPALTENTARPSVTGGSRRTENVREEEIQIVSVTSLARGNKQRGSQVTEMSIGPLAGASLRKKVMLSPASNSILTARKRLLDKALQHKARIRETVSQPGQQGTAVSRRDLSGIPNSDSRKVCILSQAPSFGLSSSRTPVMKSRFGVQAAAGVGRRSCQQRASTSVRSLHPQLQRESLPCSAIQVAHAVSLPTDKQGTGMAAVRSQQSLGQPLSQSSQSPSTLLQKSAVDLSVQGGLPEQVQMLGIEMQNLGVAVRLLVEQQGRLEHEQAQQTLVQRQILSTLQGIALRMGPGSQRHTETSPGSGTSTCNQAQFETGPVSYVPRSLPQPKLCESASSGQEALDSFKLSGLSPRKMNRGCEASSGSSSSGSGDGLSANHMPANSQTQMHVLSYEPMVYSQSYVPSYTEAYSQPQGDPPQNCSPSNHSSVTPGSPPSLLSNDSQFNIIKVETL